uniref:Uncharacterized protein n=1 Tax=Cannabis sativa TaxID=3483 RepID=A0A803QRU4_CANSA
STSRLWVWVYVPRLGLYVMIYDISPGSSLGLGQIVSQFRVQSLSQFSAGTRVSSKFSLVWSRLDACWDSRSGR